MRLGGMVQPEAVQERMLENHVVVLLSDYEGMPLCLLEGMACGLVPVCLKTESGVPEIVEHGRTGIIVEDRGDDFVAALTRLRADASFFEKLSTGAREKIKQEYSREICAQKWQDLIERLAASGRGGHKPDVAVPLMLDLPPVRSGLSREDQRAAPFALASATVKGCFKTIGTGLGAAGKSLCKGLF